MADLPPGVHKFLDASTAHITTKDDEILAAWARMEPESSIFSAPYRTISHAYGYFIHVRLDLYKDRRKYEKEARQQGISDSFFKLQEYARNCGCWWINLDRDAEILTSLPTHEW